MPERDRVIFHIDCNGFFASVEEVRHPELRQVPMAVCGNPESRRGIILAKNEKAKKYGIQTAETIYQALRKCPELVLRPPRRSLYSEFCDRVNAIYADYTDLLERASIDELATMRFMKNIENIVFLKNQRVFDLPVSAKPTW